MAAANKTLVRVAHAWRLIVVGAILAGAAQLARQQREIDNLSQRLDEQRAGAVAPAAGEPSWSAPPDTAALRPVDLGRGSEDKRQAQQHYLAGVIYFQKGDYIKAKDEWTLAKQDDPSNEDVASGLQRVEALYAGDRP